MFEVCFDAYRRAWAEAYEKGGLKAIDAGERRKNGWRPDKKPRGLDFMADFSSAGRDALEASGRRSRLAFFEMYVLGGASWKKSCRQAGISEFTGAEWLDEIREIVGQELLRRGIYPLKKYFLAPSALGGWEIT